LNRKHFAIAALMINSSFAERSKLAMPCRLAVLLIVLALASPALAQDAAEFVVRMNRLENQVRQMSGQIEQLQFENRQLKDQVRKFQEDVEFRFQEGRPGAPRAQAPAVQPPPAATQTPPSGGQARPPRRGDAFDPGDMPNAPGAPRQLGTTTPSAPLSSSGGMTIGGIIDNDGGPSGPLDLNQVRGAGGGPAPTLPARPASPSVAATGSGDPRADYDTAYAYILQKQYERAEMGFRQFLQSHPRDKLTPDATFWLGESYLQRQRPREAAEQFLKVSTEYAKSQKAPDAMLRLGIALQQLGAKDQACATFAELERKFPQAGPSVRQGVEREQKRARCA
jgi:tol-pal system protein YbgF